MSVFRQLCDLFNQLLPLKQPLGRRGEQCAAKYLKKSGYTILRTNWRCYRGEIDIIAYKDGVLAFVEVKSRRAHVYDNFDPFEAVDQHKQETIRKCADEFLRINAKYLQPKTARQIRFDIVAVKIMSNSKFIPQPGIKHIVDAFH